MAEKLGEQQSERGSRNGGAGGRQAIQRREEPQLETYRPTGQGSPIGIMRRFMDQMDRLVGDISMSLPFAEGLGWGAGRFLTPLTDVFLRGDRLVIQMDMPGVRQEDLQVQLIGNTLVISGEREGMQERSRGDYFQSERSYRGFRRSLPLPEGFDDKSIEAQFDNGVLEITLPAPERVRARNIPIKTGRGMSS